MSKFCNEKRLEFAKKDLQLKLRYEGTLKIQIKRPLLSLYRLICTNDYKLYPDVKNNPSYGKIHDIMARTLLNHYKSVAKGFTSFQTKQLGLDTKDVMVTGSDVDPLAQSLFVRMAETQTDIIMGNTVDRANKDMENNVVIAGLLARYIRDYVGYIDVRSMSYEELTTLLGFLKRLSNRSALIGLVETRNSAEITKLITTLRARQAAVREISGEITMDEAIAEISTAEHAGTALTALISSIAGMRELGATAKKEWNAILDNRTREAHRLADGQVVGIDEDFIVDGEPLMYPGDDSRASIGNTINCRCTAMYYYD